MNNTPNPHMPMQEYVREHGHPFESCISKIWSLLEKADKVIAHNASFDTKVRLRT